MVSRNQHILSFRAPEQTLERILKFAMDNGLYNAEDQPNVSAAILLLIAAGFQDHQGQQGMMTAYEVARGELIDEVRKELSIALDNIVQRIQ